MTWQKLKIVYNARQVITVAFLLLTVIILGTSGKLAAESLGTLLGTIAGYIFGRKLYETQPQAQRESAPPQIAAQGQPIVER